MKFTIPGEPCGKARPRVVRHGTISTTYTPKKTVNYENFVKMEFQRQCGIPFILGPVNMEIVAFFGVPASASKKRTAAMLTGMMHPTKKPDCDNIIKIVCDALNGLAYKDDAQIVHISLKKKYATAPRVEVSLTEAIP